MTQILHIHKRFFDALLSEENQKILRVYGYDSREKFLESVIAKLNSEYQFLNVEEVDTFDNSFNSIYHMYNGFITGDFPEYDEITVSFTTLKGKNGNVFLNQQVMPLINSKLQQNMDFLTNKRIKRIILLTTHKSDIFSSTHNVIDRDSTIQMSVKFANTLGFDTINFFPIKNLNVLAKYYEPNEIIENTRYIRSTKADNSQFQQVVWKDKEYICSIVPEGKEPKGQEMKFFSMKILSIAHLSHGKYINLELAISQTNDSTIGLLNDYIVYLQSLPTSSFIIDLDDDIETLDLDDFEDENVLDLPETIDETFDLAKTILLLSKLNMQDHENEPVFIYNSRGKRVFQTKKEHKVVSFKAHSYFCGCNDNSHIYFTSKATQRNYVEGHHMIPMEYQPIYYDQDSINLDCKINIVPLCPHCHQKIHKAVSGQKFEVIQTLYTNYETNLKLLDPSLDLVKFASFYNVYIY